LLGRVGTQKSEIVVVGVDSSECADDNDTLIYLWTCPDGANQK
jgi:hypothetical protein